MVDLPKCFNPVVATINYSDFENWIESLTGKKLDIQGGEMSNGSYVSLEIKKADRSKYSYIEFDKHTKEYMDSSEENYVDDRLEHFIAENDLLPEGKYIITVDW